jgi:hypothetical protein
MEVRATGLRPPAGERPLFQGTADQILGDIRSYAQVGVTHLVFDFTQPDLRAALENLQRFAHDVAPKLGPGPNDRAVVAGAGRSRQGVGGPARGGRGSGARPDLNLRRNKSAKRGKRVGQGRSAARRKARR